MAGPTLAPRALGALAPTDDATTALEVLAFARYLVVVLVGFALLWVVVPRVSPSSGLVVDALVPTVVAFKAIVLLVLWRLPSSLRVLKVAQYASFFPILLGYLALKLAEANDPAAVQSAIAWFAIWIPVLVAVSFYVFGSRGGLIASLAFVVGTIAVVLGAVARGTVLDGAGAAYLVTLCVGSVALAVILDGTSRLMERLSAARIAAAVAAEIALRDALTGVHSRHALEDRFDQEVARAHRSGEPLAVYFLDLDGFKAINDAHGHATGDAMLRVFAERVQGVVRASDTVGRLGGDEFVVLASVEGDAEARALAERLLAVCDAPVRVGGLDFDLSVSIGVAVHPFDGVDRSTLLHAADEAMYVAKASGRNQWAACARPERPVPRTERVRCGPPCATPC